MGIEHTFCITFGIAPGGRRSFNRSYACCYILVDGGINARDASACASAFAARSAPPPHPRDAGFLLEPIPRFIASRFAASACCALVLIAGCLRAFAAPRGRVAWGFFAGLFVSVGSSPKTRELLPIRLQRIAGSPLIGWLRPKTMRHAVPSVLERAPPAPTQNWPS